MSSRRSVRASARVTDVDADIRRSGNSNNLVDVDQSAAAAAGLIAVAAAITDGVNVDLNGIFARALESDRQARQQMLETMKSARGQ